MHNLSLGLLSCLREEAGRGKGAKAHLPALLLVNAGNRTGLCQNSLSPESHPIANEPAAGTTHTPMPGVPAALWGHAEVARGQRGFPKAGREVGAKGRHLPADSRADPAAAAGKNLELLQSIG